MHFQKVLDDTWAVESWLVEALIPDQETEGPSSGEDLPRMSLNRSLDIERSTSRRLCIAKPKEVYVRCVVIADPLVSSITEVYNEARFRIGCAVDSS